MHHQSNHDAEQAKPSRWSLLKDGTWFAAIITLSIYVFTVVENRGQLRSDVKHLTDSLAEVRKDLDAARLNNKQLNDSLRQSEIDLAKKEVRFNEVEKQLAAASQDALSSKSEAQTYKTLVTADKRCQPYKQEVEHLERSLAISGIDVVSPKGDRRQEILNNLERSKNSYDACMGLKR
ncbi:hypothetical protein [Pseudomonas chlororaphis]|uniref:hypothetical protein n=1 Tax=Pseudomonas chlororaphis TaxID=587753 RepID=UPI0023652980|nr:hypothetical protein [Pseudomonas chlororaphis]WDH25097.1 hypothetical protein PUP50_12760 [Pseudomonas chlororaphis]